MSTVDPEEFRDLVMKMDAHTRKRILRDVDQACVDLAIHGEATLSDGTTVTSPEPGVYQITIPDSPIIPIAPGG